MNPSPDTGSRFAFVCSVAAFGVPVVVASSRLAAAGAGVDDLQLVRGLGMVPAGGQGVVSSLLIRLSSLLPIGGQPLRAGFAAALVLGAVGFVCFRLAATLLGLSRAAPRLNALLAVSAALTATLGAGAQLHGATLDAIMVSSALGLLIVLLRAERIDDARTWLGLGALLALTAVENWGVGVAVVLAIAVQTVLRVRLPSRRALALVGVGLSSVLGILLLIAFARSRASGPWLAIGSTVQPMHSGSVLPSSGALGIWLHNTGPVALAVGALGAIFGLQQKKLRVLAGPLVLFVLFDAILRGVAGPVNADSCRLLALCGLSLMSALGVQLILVLLRQLHLPFSESVSVLLVAFHLTLACSAMEDSQLTPSNAAASEAWTDETLGRLPPKSLLLVQDPDTAWRAWAARMVRGERPDVVVVPISLIGDKALASKLLAAEPNLAPLIRDISVNGSPSEYSLSLLADARPLFVDLDPHWDHRLLQHLAPAALWLRFSAHPLGRSDRARALSEARGSTSRVLRALGSTDPDPLIRQALGQRIREQAVLLASLGDRDSAQLSLSDLDRIAPSDPVAAELRRQLNDKEPHKVDVVGLLN